MYQNIHDVPNHRFDVEVDYMLCSIHCAKFHNWKKKKKKEKRKYTKYSFLTCLKAMYEQILAYSKFNLISWSAVCRYFNQSWTKCNNASLGTVHAFILIIVHLQPLILNGVVIPIKFNIPRNHLNWYLRLFISWTKKSSWNHT